jgi:hypothetical protein
MNFSDFLGSFREFLKGSPVLHIDDGSRYVFLSDLHMGDGGKSDDLRYNGELTKTVLARWYLERGYTLILGGRYRGSAEIQARKDTQRLGRAVRDFRLLRLAREPLEARGQP